MAAKNREYTRKYSGFRGVDLDGGGATISDSRMALSENMYRDYEGEGGGVIESVPGFRTITSFVGEMHAIYRQIASDGKPYLLVHAGSSLYRFPEADIDLLDPQDPIGTLADGPSHGFAYLDEYYLLDGRAIHRVGGDGSFHTVTEDDPEVYVPRICTSGVTVEQRNLLTSAFVEDFTVNDPGEYMLATEELYYTVYDRELMLAAVTGIDPEFSGDVFVPRYTVIGGATYRVAKIADYAFDKNTSITSLTVSDGVTSIGAYAMRGATNLTSVLLPSSVEEIGKSALAHCYALTELYLGAGLSRVGGSLLEMSTALNEIHYALGEDDFAMVDGYGTMTDKVIIYGSEHTAISLSLPVSSPTETIDAVTIDGEEVDYTAVFKNGRVTAIALHLEGEWCISGKTVSIRARLLPFGVGEGEYPDFLTTREGERIGGFAAVSGCTVAECFDGRIFLSGNPLLPNVIFYTERDRDGENCPLYFGAHDYFRDGVGPFPVISLLSVGDRLAVFKSGDDGTGSIIYHSPKETGERTVPKIYPAVDAHSGMCAVGEAYNFLDDPVFISKMGISALDYVSISAKRSIATRSHNINAELLGEELSKARLLEWCGYLAVCTRGKIFLGDSRATFTHETGNREYEWFTLKDIGSYSGTKPVYRYASTAPRGFDVHPLPGSVAEGIAFVTRVDDEIVRFIENESGRFVVTNDGERGGGSFNPATVFASFGERLYFGTSLCELCVFNNDKRGVPPERIKSSAGFNALKYKEEMGRKIHPDFYSFIDRAPRYAVKTKLDDCGIPHLTKSTVRGSLTVKCRSESGGSLHLEVGTDRSGWEEVTSFSCGRLDFGDLDFSSLTLDTKDYYTLPMREREKKWVEKQITLWSECFRSPIAIYSITYRYTVAGKIKRS